MKEYTIWGLCRDHFLIVPASQPPVSLGSLYLPEGVYIAPLKLIEYGFGVCYNKIPIYPIFYLLKGDYSSAAISSRQKF